jgi:4-amino-4-deoxy-L-arabinose transferase-like glycosyltransferase
VSQPATPNDHHSGEVVSRQSPQRTSGRLGWAHRPEWVRSIPLEAVLIGIGLCALLTAFVAADPVATITSSAAPFTDEAGNFVNARNFVQLGRWSTDDWNLYLVNAPFSVLEAITFVVFGVGLVQARMAMVVCVSLAAIALVWGLRDAVGRVCAAFAGLAFAASGLILFYGRLAFLEDLVVLGLTLGTMVLSRGSRLTLRDGLITGLCYAIAIGTKPSALFSVVGILLAMGLVWGWRDPGIRRWIVGSTAVIVIAGLIWAIAIWLPNRAAVAIDIKIWPQYQWNLTPVSLFDSVKAYLTGKSDHIFGFLLLPLIGLGSAGLLTILALRKRLSDVEAKLALAGFAWAAFGFGILMVSSYRPNRYVVPLVPSLAILAAIGLHLFTGWLRERLAARSAKVEEAGEDIEAAPAARIRRWGPRLVAAFAIAIAVAPGLAWYGNWARHATYTEVALQNKYADAVPAGELVVGDSDAALFLMRSHARTVIIGLANMGDLYSEGARWYLLWEPAQRPVGVPEAVWAAAEQVTCSSWRGGTKCLYHLP